MLEFCFVKLVKRAGACAFLFVRNWIQCVWRSNFFEKNIGVLVSFEEKVGRTAVCILSFATLALLPQHAISQSITSKKIDDSASSWQWAAADQSVLRVIAFDESRQQIVIKSGNDGVQILKHGDSIPVLAISLSEVYANSAVFRPTNISGKNSIDAISISSVNGNQNTSISFLVPPRRSVVDGWGRIQ